jgi:prephenate dehydrogenase
MNVGVLGLGPVGRSFVDMLRRYDVGISAFDPNPATYEDLDASKVDRCDSEKDLGSRSDLLICCTDMLSGDAMTEAVKEMEPGTVVCDDFSAKAPADKAFNAAGRHDVAYHSIHTLYAPPLKYKGHKDHLVVEIPVDNCTDKNGYENVHIKHLRFILTDSGLRTKRLWSLEDHDERMGRVQAATSAQNICTAATLAEIGVNPLQDDGVYDNKLDQVKYQMALRAIGPEGSSNPRVYGLIALMNPFSKSNVDKYLKTLEELLAANESEANSMLEEAKRRIGKERVKRAKRTWENMFGPLEDTKNSFSSHLAEALFWSESGYPLGVFEETPAPPYTMREIMALTALSMHEQAVSNMYNGNTDDSVFLRKMSDFYNWLEESTEEKDPDWDDITKLEKQFFEPVRETFPEEMENIKQVTNEHIDRLKKKSIIDTNRKDLKLRSKTNS